MVVIIIIIIIKPDLWRDAMKKKALLNNSYNKKIRAIRAHDKEYRGNV